MERAIRSAGAMPVMQKAVPVTELMLTLRDSASSIAAAKSASKRSAWNAAHETDDALAAPTIKTKGLGGFASPVVVFSCHPAPVVRGYAALLSEALNSGCRLSRL
ncbi:hypothetical protein DHEL01_v208698 [Diaporthe helianthi]|uniref:Uncharacterized protein n=1 Tax=Diaporthe helianthi TaxID=158607 RepID=A0A2P5HRL8_DIAHE|nr:hypothetical protein DHEL01_v208698 [Diaporthe helianthi]